jgi:hypothetical protein
MLPAGKEERSRIRGQKSSDIDGSEAKRRRPARFFGGIGRSRKNVEDRQEDADENRRYAEGTREQRCGKKHEDGERNPTRAIPLAVEEHTESFVRAKPRGDRAEQQERPPPRAPDG